LGTARRFRKHRARMAEGRERVLEPHFHGGSFQNNMRLFEARIKFLETSQGTKGSNRQAGTAINVARETYSKVRTIFGRLIHEAGGSISGMQIHHVFDQVAQTPSQALNPLNLMLQRGHATVKGSGHWVMHQMSELLGKVRNPGLEALGKAGRDVFGKAAPALNAATAALTKATAGSLKVVEKATSALKPIGKITTSVLEAVKPAAGVLATGAKALGGVVAKGAKVLPFIGALLVANDARAAVTTTDSSERLQRGADFGAGAAGFAGPVGMAFSLGYAAGGLINQFALNDEIQNAIGGTLNEMVTAEGVKELVRHPFGIGM
jgi:hypothetical protein